MAITMGNEQIVDSTRKDLNSSEVDMALASGGATTGLFGGEPLVGITPAFATAITSAISTYVNTIEDTLNNLEAQSSKGAFQGENVETALKKFITSVKEVSMSYLNKLQAAEEEIVNSVEQVYSGQDSSLSGNMEGDADILQKQSL